MKSTGYEWCCLCGHFESHCTCEDITDELRGSLTPDPINPPHYTSHPSGVECIQITEHMNFNIGNAVKYLWRAGGKGDALDDLRKAAWYVAREIERHEGRVDKG